MELLNNRLINKLSGLLFFLKRSKKEFEMVADEVENNPLRTALNGLSDESSYYAGELNNYLSTLGISTVTGDHAADVYDYPVAEGHGDELMNICSHNEATLTQAYSELLEEENMPWPTLRELMTYQLNALKFTFLKVKTLNTARFA